MNRLIVKHCYLSLALAALPLSVDAQSPTWPDPIGLDVLPYATAGVAHGPLLGNVTANSVRVWLRTRQTENFEVIYDRRLPFAKDSPSVLGRVDPHKDRIGVVQLTGLKPNSRYYYGVRINGQLADLRESVRQRWRLFELFLTTQYAAIRYTIRMGCLT